MEQLGLKDSSRDLQVNCAISYLFYLYLMFHAYAARFDVMGNLVKFWVFGCIFVFWAAGSRPVDNRVPTVNFVRRLSTPKEASSHPVNPSNHPF